MCDIVLVLSLFGFGMFLQVLSMMCPCCVPYFVYGFGFVFIVLSMVLSCFHWFGYGFVSFSHCLVYDLGSVFHCFVDCVS